MPDSIAWKRGSFLIGRRPLRRILRDHEVIEYPVVWIAGRLPSMSVPHRLRQLRRKFSPPT